MQAEDLDSIFMLPLSQQAFEELQQLQIDIHEFDFKENEKDSWYPTWGNSYGSKRFYSTIYDLVDSHRVFSMIWKSTCTPRVKIFAWLVLVDRINTKTMLTRRHIGGARENDLCVMCIEGREETCEDLFFSCPFARDCWTKISLT
jgi:hypothetical protein